MSEHQSFRKQRFAQNISQSYGSPEIESQISHGVQQARDFSANNYENAYKFSSSNYRYPDFQDKGARIAYSGQRKYTSQSNVLPQYSREYSQSNYVSNFRDFDNVYGYQPNQNQFPIYQDYNQARNSNMQNEGNNYYDHSNYQFSLPNERNKQFYKNNNDGNLYGFEAELGQNNELLGDQGYYNSNNFEVESINVVDGYQKSQAAFSEFTYSMGRQMPISYPGVKKGQTSSNQFDSNNEESYGIQFKAKSDMKPKSMSQQYNQNSKNTNKMPSSKPSDQNQITLARKAKNKSRSASNQEVLLKEKEKNKETINRLQSGSQFELMFEKYGPLKNRPQKLIQFSKALLTSQKSSGHLDFQQETSKNFTASLFKSAPSSSPQIQKAKQFFKNVDLGLNKEAVLTMAKSKLELNENQIAQLITQLWWGERNSKQIAVYLKQRGLYFVETSDSILISQWNAVQAYLRYGQCIHIVPYHQLVRVQKLSQDTNQETFTTYNAYIFVCFDWRSQYLFLGTGIVDASWQSKRYSDSLLQTLQIFFGCMRGLVSNTIVFDPMDQNEQSQAVCFENALRMFCQKYECKIEFVNNIGFRSGKLQEQKIEQQKLNDFNEKMNIQLLEQIESFKQQVADLIDTVTCESPFFQPSIQIKKQLPLSQIFLLYNPSLCLTQVQQVNSNCKFVGFSHKLKQIDSLKRKMNWIIKPFQQRPICFTEFICSIFRFNRYLKKITKENSLDYRCDYRRYTSKQIYRLHRKLGLKVFEILQNNYLQSQKLSLIPKSPTTFIITQYLRSFCKTFTKSVTYEICFSLENLCWACNCNRIYETGIPCRHLIAVILKFGGSLEYYIDHRWMPAKGDQQKLKRFRKKDSVEKTARKNYEQKIGLTKQM